MNNNNRREFLKSTSLLTTAFLLGKQLESVAGPTKSLFANALDLSHVAILHTSDLSGRFDPFTFGQLENVGGLNSAHQVIKQKSVSHILIDAGDFLNQRGSVSDHKKMIALMNKTGYNAVAIGDKELSNGQAHLASLVDEMKFKLVNCNYEFSDPVLRKKVLPYYVIKHGGYKIGITGVGPDIRGKKSAEGIKYFHPYQKANEAAAFLKNELNCDIVICLSHLGVEQRKGQLGNKKFAKQSENIDVIVSGHNKNIPHPQMVIYNTKKSQVLISNSGYGGSIVSKLDFGFDDERRLNCFQCKNFIPGRDASFYEGYKKLTT